MYSLNHLIVKVLKSSSGNSNVENLAKTGKHVLKRKHHVLMFLSIISVLSGADKGCISTSKFEVKCQIQSVMRFLYKGQCDVIGKLEEVSKAKVHAARNNAAGTPLYFSEFEKFLEGRSKECAVIVSVEKEKFRSYFKSDLVLSSKDINECDFSFLLGTCLAEKSSNIYIECDDLNRRGLQRLLAILKDITSYFDRRVCIFLVTGSNGSSLKHELKVLAECDLCQIEEPVKKKFKLKEISEEVLLKDGVSVEMDNKFASLKSKYDKLIIVHKGLETSHEGLLNDQEILKGDHVKLQLDIAREVKEREQWKKNSDCLNEDYRSLKEKVKSSDIEHENLKNVNESLKSKLNELELENEKNKKMYYTSKESLETFKVKHEHLEMDYGILERRYDASENLKKVLEKDLTSVETDLSSQKEANVTLMKEHERLDVKQQELVNDITKLKEGVKESAKEVKNGALKTLNDTLESNKSKFSTISAPELVKKSIPRYHCAVDISNSENKQVKYSVNILKGDIIEDFTELKVFFGVGESVKTAKINAYEKFINNVKSFDG